jgi:hypothetical protein
MEMNCTLVAQMKSVVFVPVSIFPFINLKVLACTMFTASLINVNVVHSITDESLDC